MDKSLGDGAKIGRVNQNCAIYYVPEAYTGSKRFVVGRQSAGEGFLSALIKHAGFDKLYCYTNKEADFKKFQEQVDAFAGAPASAVPIRFQDFDVLAQVGCLFLPGPMIPEFAWFRRHAGEWRFSICGVTHSVAAGRAMRAIRDYIIAPTQPWDALICTSHSVKSATARIMENWAEYLRKRGFQFGPAPIQFQVIPLGVDPAAFERTPERLSRGQELRQRLGIGTDCVVGLYFGRLNLFSKSHPAPMFRAFELAQRMLPPGKLHLVLTGQFSDPVSHRNFAATRQAFAPSVPVHWVDGNEKKVAHDSWFAADFFISLSDNVQESFGLTPVEAMSASLPCVVSEWNGYKETVVDGQTGFLVPATMPPPGSGIDLAAQMIPSSLTDVYVGTISQSVAVDIDHCAACIAHLAGNASLRQLLGEAGRRRVEQIYDWRRVIPQYLELWSELAQIRTAASAAGSRDSQGESVHPDYPDLFAIFRDHPRRALGEGDRIRLADLDAHFVFENLLGTGIHTLSAKAIVDPAAISELITRLEQRDHLVSELLDESSNGSRGKLLRTIMWLYKYGLITVEA